MTEFLKLLAVYYMCDAAALERHMTRDEMAACHQTYEQVKSYFSGLEDGTPQTLMQVAARKRASYAGFKMWEAENAELVARLKAQARP